MNIVIVNTQTIPSSGKGAASVNRILSYSKGLARNGNSVRILSTAFMENCGWQSYEGIPVRHLGYNGKSLFSRTTGLIRTSFRLIRTLSKEEKDALIFVTSNYFLIILLELYCKFSSTKIINERSEYPFVIMTNNKIMLFLSHLYTDTAYKMLDGMIIMTKPLMDYYRQKASSHCRFIEVPMTVDSSRFENEHSKPTELRDYVAYCGNMGGNKDGLANLINAFSIVEKRGYPLKLLLIGGTNNQQEYDDLIALNKSLGNKNVVFYGRAEREKMPGLLQNATMLALARPSGLQSTGGFPTKLGEYLSTGNPVVVTAVGDITLYLKNKENAFVVEPDNNAAFADALCYVWDHKEEATLIGKRGKELAKTVFNGEYQAKRIEKFIEELLSVDSKGSLNV